jgi:hypothetical protein
MTCMSVNSSIVEWEGSEDAFSSSEVMDQTIAEIDSHL